MHHYLDAGAQALVCTHCQSVSPIPLGDLTFVTGVFKLWDRAHRSCKPGSSPRTWNSKPTIAISTEDNIETKRTDIRPPPGERT